MRIVHAIGWYFPDSLGGSEVYVRSLCTALRSAGHEVFVTAPTLEQTVAYPHAGVPVFRYAISPPRSRDEAIGTIPVAGGERVSRWLAVVHPDVLHVHSIVPGIGIAEIARAKADGAAVVVTHHLPGLGYGCRAGGLMQWGITPCDGIVQPARCGACTLHVRGVPKPMASALAAIPLPVSRAAMGIPGKVGTALSIAASVSQSRALQQQLFDLADVHVVLNDAAGRILAANGLSRAKLVLNRLGVSQTPQRKPGPEIRPTQAPVRFACIGRFEEAKGTAVLAAAVARLSRDVPFELEFHGPQGGAAEQLVRGRTRAFVDGDPRVRFFGPVPQENIGQVLARCDVLCCPSTGFENGPTVALEAIGAGTPVIGSRIGNLPELIEHDRTGALFPPGDVPALADVLRRIAANPGATVDAWRRHLPPVRTAGDVASDYIRLYEQIGASAIA